MGCNSSTAARNEVSSPAGATLLKGNTVALDGHHKTPVPQIDDRAGSMEPTTPVGRSNGPWTPFQDESTNGYQRRNCTSKLGLIEQGAEIEGRDKEVRFEPEPEKPCETGVNFIIEGIYIEAEPETPCEPGKPEEDAGVKEDNTRTSEMDKPVQVDNAQPHGSKMPAEVEERHEV